MTAPIELCKRGTDEVIAYACPKCGVVAGSVRTHGDSARELAERHCGPWTCRVCGGEHDWSYQTICRDCWRASQAERSAACDTKRYEAAAKVPAASYDGWVSNGDEGFWPSVGDAIDEYEDSGAVVPAWLWTCERVPLRMHADQIIESALEDHHEDAADNISGADEARLQATLDAWCESVGVESWQTDYSRVVVLRKEGER